ncbi:MAG TPA: ABC transporter permease [Ignavibacteria bacterium]|nr:ABC transporter permease [Ignavibacteria bacterium]HQY52567.1 ABC transporter permease [Ignavibacteria bacterium]HRB00181.1 ABC transporter permease [Ignavibacteria bacterium]
MPSEVTPYFEIKPRKSWRLIDFREFVKYKDLLYFFVYRDITVLYKQTVLGLLWAVLNPVVSMVIFSVIFGGLAKIDSDGIPYPIFSYAAVLPWTYFSQSMGGATSSLVGNANLLTKVYFPRIFIPLTPVLSKLMDFAIAFVILIAMMLFYQISPTLNVLFLPILMILMILTSLGLGLWLSSLAIQYRDVRFAVGFLTSILMYAAPVVFPASLVAEKFGDTAYLLYGLYPMVGVIEGFRASLLGFNPMPWDLIGMGSISAIIIFISGAFHFKKTEKIFADVA